MAPGKSRTAIRMQKMKDENPEKYEAHLKKCRERAAATLEAKKAFWATGTEEAIEDKAKYHENRSSICKKSKSKKAAEQSVSTRSSVVPGLPGDPKPKVCRKSMTPEERRTHDLAVRHKRMAGWSHQKRAGFNKKQANKMKERRLLNKMKDALCALIATPSVPVPPVPVPVPPVPVPVPPVPVPDPVPVPPVSAPVLVPSPLPTCPVPATPVKRHKQTPPPLESWRTSTPGPSGLQGINLLPTDSPLRQHCYNATSQVRKNLKKFSGEEQAQMTANIVLRPSPQMKSRNLEKLWQRPEVRRFVARKLFPVRKAKYLEKRVAQRKGRVQLHVKNSIRDFYKTPAVSRMLPHKRYATKAGPAFAMTVTVKRAWELWREGGNQEVSLAFFAGLRPKNARKLGTIPPETCLCVTCTNVSLKITALNRLLYIAQHKPIPEESRAFQFVLCPFKGRWPKFDCVNGACNRCKDRIRLYTHACWDIFHDNIAWDHWERRPDSEGKLKLDIHPFQATVSELLEQLNVDLERPIRGVSFFQHLFKAYWQQSQYALCKDSLREGEVLILQDFAENRKSTYAAEVKSAYYGKRQITLHPSVCFYRTGEGHLVRHVIMHLSQDIGKDYHMVNTITLDTVKVLTQETGVKRVILWSDGCGAQYKGKGNFADLTLCGLPMQRNYFGSEHGKGEADGETGRFAQAMKRAVAAGQNFPDAKSMVSFGQTLYTSTELKKYTFSEIQPEDIIRDRPESEVDTLPGTRSLHQVIRRAKHVVSVRNLSCFCTGCIDGQLCCTFKDYVQPFRTVDLRPRASLNDAILEEPDEEEDLEPVFINDSYPALGEWIQLRGEKPTKKGRELDYWFANVLTPPEGAAVAGFYVTCYSLQAAGSFREGTRAWQIVEDTPEDYHWRSIPAPKRSQRGHFFFM